MNPTSKDMKGIMNKSSYCLLQLLFLACLVCRPNCSSITIYGTIIPQSPTVEIGKEFTATCVLYKAAKATAEDIYWMLKDVTVPKEQYTKINDSAVSVTITITSEMANWLLCKKKETPLNLNQVIHGILLTKGYPPEKPLNLSCMAVQSGRNISSNVTCTWQPGTRDEGLETTYTLFGVSYISASNKSEKADRSSGYIDFVTFPSSQELAMWVEVENKLGKVRSDILDIYAADLVKTNPPSDVNIISENNFSRTLLVSWKHPIHVTNVTLKYNIRFCTVGSGDCTEVPLNDSESYKESFRLQYLKPDTEYVVQVRCMHHRGYWSDWSANTTTRTPEDKPTSKPDLWRVVIPSQVKSERRVQVMYKDPVYSNGRIQGYSIKIQDRNWTTVAVNGSDLDSRSQERKIIPFYQIPWSDTRRGLIELKVWNSVGESPQASLVIPKLTQEPPSVESLSWFTQEGRLWVKWQPPNVIAGDPYKSEVTEYILEWVLVSDGDMDWQRESRHTRAAAIEGNLQKFNRYNISVYPMYSGLTGKPLTIAAFLEQGAPLEGPSVKVRRTGKNDAELEWMKIPLDKQRGFITNYTICFITGGKEHSIVVSPDTYSYTLKRMASNSKYVVRVMASTIKGSTNGSDLSFNTLMYAPGQIEAIVVSVCISFLFFVVLTVLCCINKMDSIKKKIWPPVPNPSNSTIAKWSPDFPSKTDTPKENALSDVSVVEVDMFDTKSMCEEDKAGLLLKKDKYLLEELSSGIGGSSCLSLPHQSFSDSDEGSDSGQTTASTVQYSSVVATCVYKGQTPCPLPQNPKSGSSQTPSFARSESTQPLLDSEEHPEGPESHQRYLRNPYFRRLPGGNDSDSRDLGDLNQLEMEEQGLASRRFCPLEEDFQQTTPTEEDQFRDGQLGSDPSYMPQLSGYRPQC